MGMETLHCSQHFNRRVTKAYENSNMSRKRGIIRKELEKRNAISK